MPETQLIDPEEQFDKETHLVDVPSWTRSASSPIGLQPHRRRAR